jgi:hypothetical protein
MDDQSTNTLEIQSRRDDEKYARHQLLGGEHLFLTDEDFLNEDSLPWFLNHIDCFVSQSRGNKSIKGVFLCLHASFNGQDDEVWDKVGQALGNLQALEWL